MPSWASWKVSSRAAFDNYLEEEGRKGKEKEKDKKREKREEKDEVDEGEGRNIAAYI